MNEISKDELMRGLIDVGVLGVDLQEKNGNKQALSGLVAVCKEWGKTPLETLNDLCQKYPALKGVPLSYAGRLDPLAEGLMLVLVGETNKDREKYLGLDKTYEVEILFGVRTDTCDLFGLPCTDSTRDPLNFASKNSKELKSFIGKHQFPYPVYSSKTVQGKPLFQWMNEGKINEIKIPKTDVEIYSLESLAIASVRGSEILEKVELALNTVKGDFRYNEIRAGWNEFLKDKGEVNFTVVKIDCECSSGTYMRALAEEIGKKMGVPALAYSIKRTKIGGIELEQFAK